MSFDYEQHSEDPSVDRSVPKRLRKSFDKRSGPVAARSTSHLTSKPASGLHRRRRRHYGL